MRRALRRGLPLFLLLLTLLTVSCRRPKGVNAPADVLAVVATTSSDADEIAMREADEDPRTGDVYTSTELTLTEQLGSFRAESGGHARLLLEERDSRVVRTEVLEATAGSVQRLRLTFLELSVVRKTNATPVKGKPLPQLQKPYVIDIGAQPIAVTDDAGRPLPEAERAAVLREVTIGYKPRVLREPSAPDAPGPAAAPGPAPDSRMHTVRVGDPMPWLQGQLERRFSYDTSESHTEATVPKAELKEIREIDGRPVAVAAIWVQIVTTGTDERRIGTEVRGEALVRAEDGEILAMVLQGPTQVHMNLELDDGDVVTADAQGKVRAQIQRTWLERGPQ